MSQLDLCFVCRYAGHALPPPPPAHAASGGGQAAAAAQGFGTLQAAAANFPCRAVSSCRQRQVSFACADLQAGLFLALAWTDLAVQSPHRRRVEPESGKPTVWTAKAALQHSSAHSVQSGSVLTDSSFLCRRARGAAGTYLWGSVLRLDVLSGPACTKLTFFGPPALHVQALPLQGVQPLPKSAVSPC